MSVNVLPRNSYRRPHPSLLFCFTSAVFEEAALAGLGMRGAASGGGLCCGSSPARTHIHTHKHPPSEWVLITSSQISGYHAGYSCSHALLIGLRLAAHQMGVGGVGGGGVDRVGWVRREDVWGLSAE